MEESENLRENLNQSIAAAVDFTEDVLNGDASSKHLTPTRSRAGDGFKTKDNFEPQGRRPSAATGKVQESPVTDFRQVDDSVKKETGPELPTAPVPLASDTSEMSPGLARPKVPARSSTTKVHVPDLALQGTAQNLLSTVNNDMLSRQLNGGTAQ